jgi:putative oxidoreductase
MRALLSTDPVHRDYGLLILRVIVGFSMAVHHGWGKIAGGPAGWEQIGGSMANFGIKFAPAMWGFLAAFAEFGCSILLVFGTLFRPAAGMLAFTMLVAAVVHLNMPPENPRSGWSGASHAIELLAVYVALLLAGPGRFSVGRGSPKT